ncbi:DciA family protein [Streptomyces sp. ML-6]|uniref:DciA family protein n=1 Tax=Streptomyces sp. ML-6 TaxID=2982693 RepID=UPI0024BF5190|nr:DciA family protein [Streptomyces sp. ML-6]MDK0524856.1 DciA family protein [Streptomyces sp. ML-6]
MTTTTTPTATTGTTTASGVDLARVALQNALAAAKTRPSQPRRRTGAAASRRGSDGRDPMGLGDAIKRMMTERGWNTAAAGGSVLDQWPTIAPTLVGKVAAVRFDEETRTLHLRPVSPAYRTQLTLHQARFINQINAVVGPGTVHHLMLLAPGAVDAPGPGTAGAAVPHTPTPAPGPAARPEQPRPRHPGYLAALDAHRAAGGASETALAPLIREAADRQTQALLQNREPEAAFTEIAAQNPFRIPCWRVA